jgi:hypothetical protein
MSLQVDTTRRFQLINIIKKIWPFILLAVLIWVVRFWHCAGFGLYEDDYNMVSRGMAMSAEELWKAITTAFQRFEGGKPFHASIVYLLSFVGEKIGGLFALYWIGYLFITLNIFLFYTFLRRLGLDTFAFLGAIAYALYSADTTQTFLTLTLGLQPSTTFLLLAMLSYLSGRRLLSYILISGVLLTYEVPYPVFLAIPLLKKRWDKSLVMEIVKHGLVLGGILGLFILTRYLVGEPRIMSLGFPEIITVPIKQMIQGPYMSLRSFIHRPYQTLRAMDGELVIVMTLSFLFFSLVFSRLKLDIRVDVLCLVHSIRSLNRNVVKNWIQKRISPIELSTEQRTFLRLGVTGLVMLILAYPFTFTVSALVVSGRNTRVHAAAILGASILCACVTWLILHVTATYGRRWIGSLVLAGYFALLVGYGFVVQNEYTLAWQYQQEFWTELLPLIPDIEEGTVVLVDPSGLKDTIQIGANFWNLPRMLDQIYQFPTDWDEPPRVYRLVPDWRKYLVRREGIFQLKDFTTHAPPTNYKNIESSTCILIEKINGRWMRRIEPLVFNGVEFPLKQSESIGSPSYEKGYLFDYLIKEH